MAMTCPRPYQMACQHRWEKVRKVTPLVEGQSIISERQKTVFFRNKLPVGYLSAHP